MAVGHIENLAGRRPALREQGCSLQGRTAIRKRVHLISELADAQLFVSSCAACCYKALSSRILESVAPLLQRPPKIAARTTHNSSYTLRCTCSAKRLSSTLGLTGFRHTTSNRKVDWPTELAFNPWFVHVHLRFWSSIIIVHPFYVRPQYWRDVVWSIRNNVHETFVWITSR